MRKGIGIAIGIGIGGCGYTQIWEQCPTCVKVSRHLAAPSVPDGTKLLFVEVPGMLGYGWEWDAPNELLRATPNAAVLAFDWSPASSLGRVARDLAARMNELLARLPPTVERVYLIGHSAAGLITAAAADRIEVPPGRALVIANVGAPYAGMHTTFIDGAPDALWAPFALTIGGAFSGFPTPAPRVTVESWVTAWPGDPVMMPRFGHRPDDPAALPPGPRHALPPGTDHNRVLEAVVKELLSRR